MITADETSSVDWLTDLCNLTLAKGSVVTVSIRVRTPRYVPKKNPPVFWVGPFKNPPILILYLTFIFSYQ